MSFEKEPAEGDASDRRKLVAAGAMSLSSTRFRTRIPYQALSISLHHSIQATLRKALQETYRQTIGTEVRIGFSFP